MKNKHILFLSWRNLVVQRSRSFVTIGGVGIGIAAIVFLVSLGYGIQRLVINQTLQSRSLNYFDASVGTGPLTNIDSALATKVRGFTNVTGVYPQLETPAILNPSNSDVPANTIAFFNDAAFFNQTTMHLAEGRVYSDSQKEVVVSQALVSSLNKTTDEVLNHQITIQPQIDPAYQIGKPKAVDVTLNVVGITDDTTTSYVVAPIAPVQSVIGQFTYSDIKIAVTDPSVVAQLHDKVSSLGGLNIDYIGDTINQLDTTFTIIRIVLAGIGLIATLVGTLGMFGMLSVSLLQRTREIGIMKTLGTERVDVWKLFLTEGILVSVVGGVVGILFALGFGYGLNGLVNIIARVTHHSTVSFYYAPPLFLLSIFLLTLLLGILVGLLPARRAALISPLSALRYE